MSSMSRPQYVRSGEVARQSRISTDTVRWYEKRGLLPRARRSPNGYREYPASVVERIHVIQSALAVGFTVAELGRILRSRDGGAAPCREVRRLAHAKLQALEDRVAALTELRDALRVTLDDWDRRLEKTPAGQRAGLLETLAVQTSRTRQGIVLTPPWLTRKTKEGKR
jgi:MerR family transcriptional regulator, Zn(II)-responsive regulator of zntA